MEDVRRRVLSRDEKEEAADLYETTSRSVTNSENPELPSAEPAVFESGITEEIDERYYHIPGEIFIIKYADVKNMNITYYSEA